MQQLTGLDASFLYLETAATPMHVGSLCIYDQSTAAGGHVTFKQIIRFFEERLHKAKTFRRRLANVPLGLARPYWIEDPEFDLEFHLRHIALPKPGDWRQLCILTARLLARPLDLNRPLWEAWVIEGLDNVDGIPPGSFGLVTKIHHSAIDGISGAEIAAAIHSLTPHDQPEPPPRPWTAEREPTDVELLARSAAGMAGTPLKIGKLVRHVAPTLPKLATGLVRRDISLPRSVPRTRFNANVSAHRVFDARTFALDEIRGMKGFVEGATVNDVIVSVCGGALRKYLEAKDELPDESLIAMAPMSVRSDQQRGAEGNRVSAMRLPVGSDIEDPLERLRAVHAASDEAKRFTRTAGPELNMELAEFLPTTTSGLMAKAYGRWHMAERLPPVFNTVITNVPISNHPLYSMGTKMVAYYGLGPVVHGVGLFQPVIGYDGKITVSAISCREMMPDPAFYCECLQESFDELKAMTVATAGKRAKAVMGDGAEASSEAAGKKTAGKKPAGKKSAAKKAARKKSKRKKKTATTSSPSEPQAD
ncbi:WS/DGAT/MGAT family O-acyltransferase [Lentisalinibacter salinarum]|uniref:WS/DGAT/MGAT family O-acyltransferase n=1 Tax=Lentisalinibacter salinarum TaxID=2992239 RepID=UPI003864D2A5